MSLLRQGRDFVLAGLAQLLLDWGVFVLASACAMPVPAANLCGRTAGALLGFWLNGRVTFADAGQSRLGWRRFARFLALWLLLTACSTLLVGVVGAHAGLRWAWLAKPVVEAGLAVVSFLLWRHVVYR